MKEFFVYEKKNFIVNYLILRKQLERWEGRNLWYIINVLDQTKYSLKFIMKFLKNLNIQNEVFLTDVCNNLSQPSLNKILTEEFIYFILNKFDKEFLSDNFCIIYLSFKKHHLHIYKYYLENKIPFKIAEIKNYYSLSPSNSRSKVLSLFETFGF